MNEMLKEWKNELRREEIIRQVSWHQTETVEVAADEDCTLECISSCFMISVAN